MSDVMRVSVLSLRKWGLCPQTLGMFVGQMKKDPVNV